MRVNLEKFSTRTDAKKIPSVFCFIALFGILVNLWGCSDFLEPVESTPEPTEYSFNYWLLNRTYLFEDELTKLSAEGDSVQDLYSALDDPFTRYVPPSKSEETSTAINTSIVQGDVGMEYYLNPIQKYPLCISRVYAESPAGKAGVPRYSCIKEINGVDLSVESDSQVRSAYVTYDSVLTYNKKIVLQILYQDSSLTFEMEKEDVYAPTVFVDTVYETIIVSITEFKQTTVNRTLGTFGELQDYLDSTKNSKDPRILDLRGNPGGHVNQCLSMADLFIKDGIISTRSWRTFDANGAPVRKANSAMATPGDAGEGHNFIVLVNGRSASCAEIFTAAISEGAGIPVVGSKTYGKGIGQTTWNTYNGGLAIITNLEFLTPKGNSYHKKGIVPDIECGTESELTCGINALRSKYGKTSLQSDARLDAKISITRPRKLDIQEYAILSGNDFEALDKVTEVEKE